MKKPEEEKLSDLARRLKSIIDTAIDGIIIISERGIVEEINPAAAHMFGYDAEEIIGKNVNFLMPSPHHEMHDGYIKSYRDTGKAKIIGIGREVKGKKKDGTIFPFRLAVSEVLLEDRRVFTGVVHDLTDVKEAELKVKTLNTELEQKVKARTEELASTVNKLLQTNQQLEHEVKEREQAEMALRNSLDREKELNAMKSRFVSMASHQFRTPLSSILSSAELIEAYKSEDEKQSKRDKHTGRIKKAVQHLIDILNDFLSLSRLEEGQLELQNEKFNLDVFCQEIQEETEGLLKPGQQILHKSIGSQIELNMDKKCLKHILFNLLSNAVKYSNEGQVVECHTNVLDLEGSGKELLIKVVDHGIGIPIEEQKHLFTRFFRAHNADNIQGTGLGLNIVKRYIDLMEGRIEFESSLGNGSTFSVYLPLKN